MRVIDYSRHLNQKQWRELAWLMNKPIAAVALSDVTAARKEVKVGLNHLVRGDRMYRFYKELLRALGGHEWHGPP